MFLLTYHKLFDTFTTSEMSDIRTFLLQGATYTFHMIDLKTINAVLGEFEGMNVV